MKPDQLAEMTDYEKQIAIGRICGLSTEARPLWNYECIGARGCNFRSEAEAREHMAHWSRSPDDGKVYPNGQEWSDFFPDYCNSLDAMHEAEKVMNHDQQCDYLDALGRTEGAWWDMTTAPASKRADSFLLTMSPPLPC